MKIYLSIQIENKKQLEKLKDFCKSVEINFILSEEQLKKLNEVK